MSQGNRLTAGLANRWSFVLPLLAAFSLAVRAVDGERDFRVLTFNIMGGRFHQTTGEFRNYRENLKAIADVVRSAAADVVLLQEVDVGVERSGGLDEARFLADELGLDFRFAPAIVLQGGHYGVAVLSRWPIMDHRVIPLFVPGASESLSDRSRSSSALSEQRVAQIVRIDLGGQMVSVVNTHLGLSQQQRRVQLLQIAAALEQLLPEPQRSVVFGGDLNCEPDASELRPIRERLQDSYHDVPDGKGGLRNIPIRDRLTIRSDELASCIDYLFYGDKKLEVVETRVLLSTASDHRPVLARLRFR